jgi:hypothetical protein
MFDYKDFEVPELTLESSDSIPPLSAESVGSNGEAANNASPQASEFPTEHEKPAPNPWHFDHYETGHYEIQDKFFAGFDGAVKDFYRDLQSEPGYRHTSFTEVTFRTLESMVKFVGNLRKMRTDFSGSVAGPFAYLSLVGNTAVIAESTWRSSELRAALKDLRISCSLNVFHQFVVKFANEKEERHFNSDCDAYGVKFGDGRRTTPKFRLPSTPTDPETIEAVYLFDEDIQEWTARRNYDGFEFEVGPFGDHGEAANACAQFDLLVSLIPAFLG